MPGPGGPIPGAPIPGPAVIIKAGSVIKKRILNVSVLHSIHVDAMSVTFHPSNHAFVVYLSMTTYPSLMVEFVAFVLPFQLVFQHHWPVVGQSSNRITV